LDHLPKGGVCAEIGVQKGDFASQILERSDPKRLYLIDPWIHQIGLDQEKDKSNVSDAEHELFLNEVESRFRTEINSGQVKVIRDYGDRAMRRLGEGQLNWVYLDGDHTRAGIRSDLSAADYVLADDGYLCGHDYGHWPDLGIEVQMAVDEFCVIAQWQMAMRTLDDPASDGFDSFVLERRPGVDT
jgi:hypothetical protein